MSSPNIDRFFKCFHFVLSKKFAIKRSLKMSPHLNTVAILPCEMSVFKNQTSHQPQLRQRQMIYRRIEGNVRRLAAVRRSTRQIA